MIREAGIDVFAYLDYRSLLRDFYEAHKARGRGFSYRVFARRAGLKSPGHLKRVIDGERGLSGNTLERYIGVLDCSDEEAAYFRALVTFNQSSDPQTRRASYQRLAGFRGYRKAQHLDVRHADYFAHWYIPAVRELAHRPDFRADPQWIARRMVPSIRPKEAQHALKVLFDLDLLEASYGGGAEPTAEVVSTGPQTRGVHGYRYHEALLEHSKRALDVVVPSERDFSALTFPVGPDGLDRIKQRLIEFRRELINLATSEKDFVQVVHVGMQVFPMSTDRSQEEES